MLPFLYFERNEKDIKAGKNVKISQHVPQRTLKDMIRKDDARLRSLGDMRRRDDVRLCSLGDMQR